jgi:HD-like signal output (HDOD) protein
VGTRVDILKSVEQISTIPTLPTVVDKLTRLLQNPQTSAEEVGRAITTDQSLASKVLKLVNSAFYGFPGRIGTITHAVVILGFSTVKNVVLTASIFDAFKRSKASTPGFNIEQFWLHSVACGAASLALAKQIGISEREECFIAGLIHDIGKIILCQHLPEEFSNAFQNAQNNDILFYESEKQIFESTHQDVGGLLAANWHLPPNLQHAVKFHHVPSTARDHFTITAIVHTADILVRALDHGNGGDNRIPAVAPVVWQNLGLDSIALEGLLENIDDEVQKATIFMQI